MSKLHREAFAHLLYGISNDGCMILLTGDVGTGKTTVGRCIIEQLPENTAIAIILNPELTITELLKTICEELNIPVPQNVSSEKTYIDSLNSYLLKAHAKGRNTTLLIDEAQNLDIKVLEQLRLLTNLETDTHKLLQIVLLGQPELRNILSSPQLAQLNQRITSRYHLQPLKPDDVEKYIRHRITIAGGSDTSLFSLGAVKHIIKFSKGVPRVINLLCDRGLLGAYAENKNRVNLKIIRKAAREISLQTNHPFLSIKRLTAVLLVLLLGICLPAAIYFLNPIPLFQLLQPEVKQAIKPLPPEPVAISKSSRQRVIIINPVSYDADLKENREQSRQSLLGETDLSGENSAFGVPDNDQHDYDEIKTSEIE